MRGRCGCMMRGLGGCVLGANKDVDSESDRSIELGDHKHSEEEYEEEQEEEDEEEYEEEQEEEDEEEYEEEYEGGGSSSKAPKGNPRTETANPSCKRKRSTDTTPMGKTPKGNTPKGRRPRARRPRARRPRKAIFRRPCRSRDLRHLRSPGRARKASSTGQRATTRIAPTAGTQGRCRCSAVKQQNQFRQRVTALPQSQ